MPTRHVVPSAIIACCSAATASAAMGFWGIGHLGMDPSGEFSSSRVSGLSADGSVAAGTSSSGDGPRAIAWSLQGGLVALDSHDGAPPMDAASGTTLDGLTHFGTSTSDSSTGFTIGEATTWTGGVATRHGYLGGDGVLQSSFLDSASNGAVLVGLSSSDETFEFEAARWSNGVWTSLGTGEGSSATAISQDASTIVGTRPGTNGALLEAFMWTESGSVMLQDLANGGFFDTGATALDVSADGSRAVGWATDFFTQRPVMWDAAGNPTDLGVPLGFDGGLANAITDDGTIVVGSAFGFEGEAAFIWTEATGSLELADYLSPYVGSSLDGWTLTSAEAVSADGLTFAGVGFDPDGNLQGWVATIPSPAGTGLFALLGARVSRRRR